MAELVNIKKELMAMGREFGYEKAELKKYVDEEIAKWYVVKENEAKETRELEEKRQVAKDLEMQALRELEEKRSKEARELEEKRSKEAIELEDKRQLARQLEMKDLRELEEKRELAKQLEMQTLRELEEKRAKEARDFKEKEIQDMREIELLKIQSARDLEDKRQEVEERKLKLKARAHQEQLELAKQEVTAREKLLDGTAKQQAELNKPRTRLAFFNPEVETIDEFLTRFDSFIANFNYSDIEKKQQLGQILQGESSRAFTDLTRDPAITYADLKTGLMRTFQCTAEGFRKMFRRAIPKANDTMQAFGTRLRHYLDRWIDLTDIRKTYEGLFDLILRDQFLHIAPPAMTTYLQRNPPTNFSDMLKLADTYNDYPDPVITRSAPRPPYTAG